MERKLLDEVGAATGTWVGPGQACADLPTTFRRQALWWRVVHALAESFGARSCVLERRLGGCDWVAHHPDGPADPGWFPAPPRSKRPCARAGRSRPCATRRALEGFAAAASTLWVAFDRDAARRDALTDSLTGLTNRRGAEVELARALARATRNDEALSVCMLDLGGFKELNDTAA
ncbi:MAG: diguanylate cyclase [Trueperaceae bacterium]|nr:diguanylate cyclase [Trueperaceae bacterium]